MRTGQAFGTLRSPKAQGQGDAWFNPRTNGQGFLITVFPKIRQMFLA